MIQEFEFAKRNGAGNLYAEFLTEIHMGRLAFWKNSSRVKYAESPKYWCCLVSAISAQNLPMSIQFEELVKLVAANEFTVCHCDNTCDRKHFLENGPALSFQYFEWVLRCPCAQNYGFYVSFWEHFHTQESTRQAAAQLVAEYYNCTTLLAANMTTIGRSIIKTWHF